MNKQDINEPKNINLQNTNDSEKDLQYFINNENLSDNKNNILGICLNELETKFIALGLKKFNAIQTYKWIYQKGVLEFDQMTNLGKKTIEILKQNFSINLPKIKVHQKSVDGTQKWLLTLNGGHDVEMVFIPEEKRGTLCISSQVGCTLNCTFCHTGTQRLVRNLCPGEIIAQIIIAKNYINDWHKKSDEKHLTNIVFMGMGEPLYNTDNVISSIKILLDDNAFGISKRRITVSTSGICEEIIKLGQNVGVALAVSLHAPNNEDRSKIMSINKKYPIEQLLETCKKYLEITNSGRITWEYVMLDGVNDTEQHANQLLKLIKNIDSLVNIIPFNPWNGTQYECSSRNKIYKFAKILGENNIPSPIRKTRGQDIMAACGQLKSETEKEFKHKKNNT